MQKKYLSLFALGGLLLAAAAGGTWAYWTQELEAVNEFQIGKYDTTLIEEFTPPGLGEWMPGVEVEKAVQVRNDGTIDQAVISHIHHCWIREEDVLDGQGNPVPPAKGERYALTFPVSSKDLGEENPSEEEPKKHEYAALIQWGDTAAMPSVEHAAKELGIEQTVSGIEDPRADGKWILIDAKEDAYGYSDLYFLYAGIVPGSDTEKKESTSLLLKAVTMNPKLNATVTEKYQRAGWDAKTGTATYSNYTVVNPKYGYDSSRYTMDIEAVSVQATASALREVWKGRPGMTEELCEAFISAFEGQLIPEYVDASKQ